MSSLTTKLLMDSAITLLLAAYAVYLWRLQGNQTALESKLKKTKADPKVYDTYKKLYSLDFVKVIALLAASSVMSVMESALSLAMGDVPDVPQLILSLLGLLTLFWALYLAYTLFRKKRTK